MGLNTFFLETMMLRFFEVIFREGFNNNSPLF